MGGGARRQTLPLQFYRLKVKGVTATLRENLWLGTRMFGTRIFALLLQQTLSVMGRKISLSNFLFARRMPLDSFRLYDVCDHILYCCFVCLLLFLHNALFRIIFWKTLGFKNQFFCWLA